MSKKSERAHIRIEPRQLEFVRNVAKYLDVSCSEVHRQMVNYAEEFFGVIATAEAIRKHQANAQPLANRGDRNG